MTDNKMKLGEHRGVKKTLSDLDKPSYKPTKPLQILLDPETHAKFKTLCSLRGVKMTEITKAMVEDWIAEQMKSATWLK